MNHVSIKPGASDPERFDNNTQIFANKTVVDEK